MPQNCHYQGWDNRQNLEKSLLAGFFHEIGRLFSKLAGFFQKLEKSHQPAGQPVSHTTLVITQLERFVVTFYAGTIPALKEGLVVSAFATRS
jgi:hypothetical protein